MALYRVEDYDHCDIAPDKHSRFMEVLRKHSLDPMDPIQEWRLEKMIGKGERQHCICSQPIEINYYVSNDFTKTSLVIGSECINRWLKPKLVCETCDAVLGNATARIREQNLTCKACKQKAKVEAAEQERIRQYQLQKRQKRARQLETLVLFWYGPYYKKQFKVVAMDEAYVEQLLNIPEERWTPTLKAFNEYAHCVFDIEDRPG